MNFIDNPNAPTLYADEVSGCGIVGNNLRVTLEAMHFCYASEAEHASVRVVVGRLTMPLESAVRMARGILDLAEQRRNAAALEQASPLDALN